MARMELTKIKEFIRKHSPEILTVVGVAATVSNACLAVRLNGRYKRRSNNWLKMHGYPMRRKKQR